ncbi:MAG: tetratricopeptide (TPR) repeat protein [Desulforhopalus sp.]|jgi:tetratricopeptide (TPR) repeat protein
MAKRRKKKFKSQTQKAASLDSLPLEELIKRGNLLIKQEKFPDAIAYYKDLLKLNEQREELLQGLEQAYQGRIMALAAKSMFKEAIALLDVLIQRFPNAKTDLLKLNLMLQAGNYAEAVRLYSQCHDELAPKRQQQIEALFGALLLADNNVKLDFFEPDSAIAQIYPNALAAIDISCSTQKDKVEEVLRQIPIRSPYRDLRTLLTGVHHFPFDKAKGIQILRKIDTESPYHYSAAAFLAATDSAKSLLANLVATPKADRSKLPGLNGLPVRLIRMLEKLADADDKPLLLHKIVLENERYFIKEDIFELYRNIIPFCRAQAIQILTRTKTIGTAEKIRLCALAAEQDGRPISAVTYWSDYLKAIESNDSKNNNEFALVMRHQVKLMKQDRYEYSPEEVLSTMLKSLEYDPAHAQTWLDASKYSKRYQSKQQHY